jgi:hypothetical protein
MGVRLSHTLRKERSLRAFKNRVLRGIIGLKREEVAGDWRRLHNVELRNLFTVTNIIRVIESRRIRREGHVARIVEMRSAYKILVRKPEGLRVSRRIILKWMSRKQDEKWTEFNWLRIGISGGFL